MRAGEPVTLNFANAEIEAVARTMATITGRNVVVDPRVKGQLTLITERAVPPMAAFQQFLAALRLQDGDKVDLVVMDGTAFYQGTMEVLGREVTQSGLGPRAAIKILCSGVRITENGGKVNRPVRTGLVWVSDDAARLPLRVEGETELGKAEFVLTSFEPGPGEYSDNRVCGVDGSGCL